MPLAQGTVGQIIAGDGALPPSGVRQGRLGDLIVSELHGRFFEQTFRGNLYSIGSGLTALSANTITLTATTTPILGVWNPPVSGVNLVMLQAGLAVEPNAIGATTGPGPFVWASSVNNANLTLGSTPLNRKTLLSAGSLVKGFPGGVALTGLTNNLVVFDGADLPIIAGLATGAIAAGTADPTQFKGFQGVQNFDGSLIVPPGGVLALLNSTSTTSISVAGRLMWEEVPL